LSRYIKIGAPAKLLGVTPQTLRRWEREGQVSPDRVSEGGTRYYEVTHLLGLRELETDLTVAYARVSSHDQKEDLKRQGETLERYCAKKGWRYELIQDLGSGMNYRIVRIRPPSKESDVPGLPSKGIPPEKEGPEASSGNDPESSGQEGGFDPQRSSPTFWSGNCVRFVRAAHNNKKLVEAAKVLSE